MKKYFYSHLIELDILETQLNTLNLTAEEKKELTAAEYMAVLSRQLTIKYKK